MYKIFTLFLFALSISIPLSAQFTNVLIDNNNFGPEEPSIAINPVNPSEVAAGSNIFNSYYSNDGGATWTKSLLFSTYGEYGDPCLVADSLGSFFYFHLVSALDKILCQKSVNGGSSYSNGNYTSNNNSLLQDKNWAAVDRRTNNLYVTWTQYDNDGSNQSPSDSSRIYFAKSTDHGNSFTNGMRINTIAGDCVWLDITDPHPFAGPNGEVYVTFMDSAGIRLNKSTDGGNIWLPNQPLIASCNGRYNDIAGVDRIRTMPYSACDQSNSPYRGHLYVSWADQRNGAGNSDIFFIKSSDGGSNWTAPEKVNPDNSQHQQYRNAMAVDQTNGYIYIVYYDRRNYSNNDSTDIYLSKSTDGGNNWTDYKISSSGFFSDGSVFDGDYIDIAAHAGKVRPIWTRTDNGNTSVWTCLYDEFASVIADNNALEIEFTVNPNPANAVAAVSFKNEIKNDDGVIVSAEGKTILTFSMNHQREKVLDLTGIPAGIYFVKVGTMMKKLIVVR